MISLRKQLFALLFCTGVVTILMTALFVNLTIQEEFEGYIELNIQKTSEAIVERLRVIYKNNGGWNEKAMDDLAGSTQVGNFSVAVLNPEKELVWGMTELELVEEIKRLDYPLFYGSPWQQLKEMIYTFEDIAIKIDGDTVGYARIGYFPSFLLSKDDILFQSNINRSIVGSGLIGLVCFCFIGLYMTNLVTKPIYAIAKTSVDLAEGKWKKRYKKHSRIKEIENLRHSMNYLAQKLDQQDELRRKLISDVSHEIRTPLHILQSNLEAMIDGIYPIDDDQMQVLYQEVVRFGSLLNNLDKLKNVEEDITTINPEEMHMNTCIREVYNTFKIVAREKKIKYRLESQETEHVVVLGDHGALKQVFMNLLSNAFKFTTDGSITIETHLRGRMMHIIIEDTGIGIAQEDLSYIFERMYRGDKSRERFEGSGIGLTIVKRHIMLHGGRIDINSEENKGTRVIVQLPVHYVSKTSMLKALSLKK